MIGYWLVSTRKKKQIIKNISSSPQPIIPSMVEKMWNHQPGFTGQIHLWGAVVVICPAITFASHKRNLSDVFHEVPCSTLFETCQLYSKMVVYHWLCQQHIGLHEDQCFINLPFFTDGLMQTEQFCNVQPKQWQCPVPKLGQSCGLPPQISLYWF